jgi:uncharacterized protein YceH (UPF0502 family)
MCALAPPQEACHDRHLVRSLHRPCRRPPASSTGFDLDDFEVRVLAVLIEKSFVTPDTYPLSVNALLSGCNQLTGREPVMNLSEATILATLHRLAERGLVSKRHQAGARVAKWEHQIRLRHSLTPPMQAVLTILMLRGAANRRRDPRPLRAHAQLRQPRRRGEPCSNASTTN